MLVDVAVVFRYNRPLESPCSRHGRHVDDLMRWSAASLMPRLLCLVRPRQAGVYGSQLRYTYTAHASLSRQLALLPCSPPLAVFNPSLSSSLPLCLSSLPLSLELAPGPSCIMRPELLEVDVPVGVRVYALDHQVDGLPINVLALAPSSPPPAPCPTDRPIPVLIKHLERLPSARPPPSSRGPSSSAENSSKSI